MDYKEPSDLKISIHVITCNIGSEIKLYQLSRLLNIYDEHDTNNNKVFDTEYGNFLSINNYSEEKKQFTDFPRGRMEYNLPSQVFNNQITLIYKYFGFKEINVAPLMIVAHIAGIPMYLYILNSCILTTSKNSFFSLFST